MIKAEFSSKMKCMCKLYINITLFTHNSCIFSNVRHLKQARICPHLVANILLFAPSSHDEGVIDGHTGYLLNTLGLDVVRLAHVPRQVRL